MRDQTKLPVTFSVIRYPSGGGTVEVSNDSGFTFGEGQAIDADTDFNDVDQSLDRYLQASAGTVTVRVTDYRA